MLLRCPSCDQPIKPEDLSFELQMAKCHACDHVFVLPRPTQPPAEAPARAPAPHSQPALPARPEGITEARDGGETVLSWRWYSPLVLFLIPFSFAWDSFLVVWYSMALGTGAPWLFVLFPIAHVAAGIGITWFTLALLLNRTEVRIGHGTVRVHHGPLYWPGGRELPLRGLERAEVIESMTQNRRGSVAAAWDVHLVTGGASYPLLSGLERPKADWVAAKIEALAR